MPQIKNILVLLEMNENAVPVVAWAALSARAMGSQLTLLHVNEAFDLLKTTQAAQPEKSPEMSSMIEEWRSAANHMAQLELTQLAERFCTGISVETLVLEGRARSTILTYLDQTPADLVVIGTHGKPWYHPPLLGSTTEAILRMLSLPVLVIHNTAPVQHPPRLQRVLCATDFSQGSRTGEEWTGFLAAHGASEILAVHAIENPLSAVYAPDQAEPEPSPQGSHPPSARPAQPFWDQAHRVVQEKLTRLQQEFQAHAPLRVELFVREGAAAEAIRAVAGEKTADLIVMGTHGHTGMRHMLIGRETERVVRTAPCPVLVVPRRR